MAKIQVILKAAVAGEGTTSEIHNVEAQAFGKVVVPVLAGETVEAQVQPSDAAEVKLFFIRADKYSEKLTYDVDGGASGVKLDGPQLLAGAGAGDLLGAAPKKLTFKSAADNEDVTVHILVGRDAVAGP